MSAQDRNVKIGISVNAWAGVLLAATYPSSTPKVLGQYSWGHVTLLGILVCIAVMADPLVDVMKSFSTGMASLTTVSKREGGLTYAMTQVNALGMELAQTLSEAKSYGVGIVLSCRRVTRRLMSSGSHLS